MAYPARLLGVGEEVILEVRPHWRYLAGSVVLVVLALVVSATVATLSAPGALDWAVAALLAATVLRLLWRYSRWASTSLVVTTRRLIGRRGLLVRSSWETMLDRVSDVSCRQGLLGRILRYGDVVVDTAGRDGEDRFANVPHPAEIQAEIQRQAFECRAPRSFAGTPSSQFHIPEQIEKLDELRRRGIVTEAEFEAKKAQLLDRL